MRKIIGFFNRRWLISLIGALAVALFIWFIGPLFAFAGYEPLGPELNRLVLIGAIFLIWLIVQGWKFYKARRENSAILNSIASAPEPDPTDIASKEELDTLKSNFDSAMSQLKETKLGGTDQRFLYQLPWYIIIGPPGSGKTTLLVNSDLKFPLSEKFGNNAIRGVGGTRNCDWWFADDAVLLDTAGRYTTQDSHEEIDRSAWLGFLGLLKKHRRRRPINGVLIAVSISDLVELNEDGRKAHSHAIRKRINELYEELGIQVPVYLIFTKCDLLAGFMEYFDELDGNGRAQVWGTTFPFNEEQLTTTIEQLDTEFDLLEEHLQEQLLTKLDHERNAERRDLIYTFPHQFNSLKQLVSEFAKETFEASRYQQPVMVRGVYFTSATQEGSPIDRIMSSLASNFGLDRQSLASGFNQGKSFFINKLLKEVIFAESGLAGTNQKFERKRLWFQRGAIAAAIALVSLTTLLWFLSYSKNLSYIEDVSVQADELQILADELNPDQRNLLDTLPLLDKARHLPGGYADQLEGRPWGMTFGLYQGDKLGEAENATYHRLLKDAFLPRLMSRIEQQIQENGNDPYYLYEALKVYLMLGDGRHFDKETILAWVSLDWDHRLPPTTTTDQRQSLNQHLLTLFETRPAPLPRPLDASLVDQSRNVLARSPLAERVYGRLKLELKKSDVPDFRVSEAAGRDAPLVLARKSGLPLNEGVSGLFTYDGYYKLFLPESESLTKRIADESWILGEQYQITPSGQELETLRDDVLKLYLDDYVLEWESLLDDIQIAPFTSLAQTVEMLNILSSDRSPLQQLLVAVEKETTLDRTEAPEKNLIDKAADQLQSAKSKLSSIVSKAPGVNVSIPAYGNILYVTNKFNRLNGLVRSVDGAPAPINKVLSLLNELYVYLNALLQATGEELVMEQQKQIAVVSQKVKTEAKRQPSFINQILTSAADGSSSLVGGGVCEHLNATWQTEVLSFCTTAIRGRYPIDANSKLDITKEDFGLFFGPNGKMDAFFTKYLAQFVDKSRSQWRWSSRDGSPSCLSNFSLQQFKNADTINKTFFRSGTQTPSVGFSLAPISMSGEITQLNLDIDGQKLGYAHGPVRSTPMKWPSLDNTGQVGLYIYPPIQGGTSGLTFEGPWSLFRLFDQADLHQLGRSEKFVLTFNIQGREVKMELRANSALNPFKLKELQQFQCMSNL